MGARGISPSLVGMGPRFSSGGCKQVPYSDGSPLPMGGGRTSARTLINSAGPLAQVPLAQSPDLRRLSAGHQKVGLFVFLI